MGKNISVGSMHTRTLTKKELISVLNRTYSSDDAEVAIVTRLDTSDRNDREARQEKQSIIFTTDLDLDSHVHDISGHTLCSNSTELSSRDAKHFSEMIAVKQLGEEIGYGCVMNWAAALWRALLIEHGLSLKAAYAPRTVDSLTDDDNVYDHWLSYLNGKGD